MRLCIVFLTFISLGNSNPETHRFIHVEKDGRSVSQDIIHDAVENTVMVIIGDVSMFENYIPTVNLHDFNTGYVAFKDIKNKICMLSKTPYPRAMPEIYRMGTANFTVEYIAKDARIPLSHEETIDTAGSRIADFCRDYVKISRELIPVKPNIKREASPEEGQLCIFCKVNFGLRPYMADCGDDIFGK